MIQPKYDPKESLERIKLMMNYDSSKTLNENKKSIGILTEQPDDDSSSGLGNAGSYTAGLATPTLLGKGKQALSKLNPFGKKAATDAAEKVVGDQVKNAAKKQIMTKAAQGYHWKLPDGTIKKGAELLGKIPKGSVLATAEEVAAAGTASTGMLGSLGTLLGVGADAGAGAVAMAALPWVAGAAAVGGLGYWLYDSITNGMPTADKVKNFFEGCSAQDKNLKPTKSDGEVTAAVEKINKAIVGLTTDEDAIKTALTSMTTAADLCELKQKYDFKYGNLYEDLDGDIDGSDWQTYVWAPMSVAIEKSTNDIKKAITQPENPPAPVVPAAPVDDNSGEEQIDGEQIDGETPDDILNQ